MGEKRSFFFGLEKQCTRLLQISVDEEVHLVASDGDSHDLLKSVVRARKLSMASQPKSVGLDMSEVCKVGSGVLAVPDQLCNASFP